MDLKAPLKEDTEYYDATPGFEAATAALKEATERLAATEVMMQRQLSINLRIIEKLNDQEQRLALLESRKPSALILPERLDS